MSRSQRQIRVTCGQPDLAAGLRMRGWAVCPPETATRDWVSAAVPVAAEIVDDPAMRARWLRHDGTWFAGVNVFPNGPDGSVPGQVPPLTGMAIAAARDPWPGILLDPAQISVTYPGYPRRGPDETETAARFRRNRDAAHVDGLIKGPDGRRRAEERHAFVLGIVLTEAPADAAPLVVWEGSHDLMRRAFMDRLSGIAAERWSDIDITEVYGAARSRAFETCRRVPVHAPPGGAILVHRLALHGVAPWASEHTGPRAIAYFRPAIPSDVDPATWLTAP